MPFLPQDNDAAACDPSASAVVALLNDRLGRLLRSDAPTFWAHLAHDASIANALDTYLQFRRRPHDARLDGDVTNAASAEEHDLARRVFLVHRRVGDGGEPNAPALATRSAIVRHRNLVDPPKVLDLCALYGPDNPRDLERVLARLVETRDAVVARLGFTIRRAARTPREINHRRSATRSPTRARRSPPTWNRWRTVS